MKLLRNVLALAILLVPALAHAQGVPISQLPTATFPFTCAEVAPVVQAGVTKRAGACGLAIPFVGSSAPSPLSAFQSWWDTSTSPPTFRAFDGAQWFAEGTANTSTHIWKPAGVSIGLTLPSNLFASVANADATGTLVANYTTVGANFFLAGPTSGSAALPTLRALVAADLPAGTVTASGNNVFSGTNQFTGGAEIGSPTGGMPASGVLNVASILQNNVALGSAAFVNTGTSGAALGLLNGNLTFGGNDIFSNLLLDPVGFDAQTGCLCWEIPNASTTGTTVHDLAKLTITGNNAFAVITAISDTSGIVGIVTAGAGTTGNAIVATAGNAQCNFDGTATAGHYVIESASVAGDCSDGGATQPSSNQSLGRIVIGGTGAGLYSVQVYAPDAIGKGVYSVGLAMPAMFTVSGSPVTGTGTLTAALANETAGTLFGNNAGSAAAPVFTAAPVLGLPATTAGTLGLANGGALGATITLQNLGATTAYNWDLPATPGSSGNILASAGGSASMTWDTTTGSGTVLVLATSPTITTPTISGTMTTAGGSISSTVDTQPAFAPTGTSCSGGTYFYQPAANEIGTCLNGALNAVWEPHLNYLMDESYTVNMQAIIYNSSASNGASDQFELRNNTGFEYTLTLNGGATTTGNGTNSTTANAVGNYFQQCNGTNCWELDTSGLAHFLATGSWSANGSVATTMTSLGPTGSHATIQEWLTIVDSGGTTRYIPAY